MRKCHQELIQQIRSEVGISSINLLLHAHLLHMHWRSAHVQVHSSTSRSCCKIYEFLFNELFEKFLVSFFWTSGNMAPEQGACRGVFSLAPVLVGRSVGIVNKTTCYIY